MSATTQAALTAVALWVIVPILWALAYSALTVMRGGRQPPPADRLDGRVR